MQGTRQYLVQKIHSSLSQGMVSALAWSPPDTADAVVLV